MYCKALQYLVPLLTEEPDASKRQALRNRVVIYMNRAEEIKSNCGNPNNTKVKSNSDLKRRSLEDLLEPDIKFKQLCMYLLYNLKYLVLKNYVKLLFLIYRYAFII